MDVLHQLGPWEIPFPALMAAVEASGLCTVTLLGMAYENDRTAVCNKLTKRLGRSVREINDLLDEIKQKATSLASPVALEGNSMDQKQFMSSGLPTLDRQLGGGFPVGEVSEVFGASGSGKSQLLLQVAARCSERTTRPGVLHISTELPIETRRLFGNKLVVHCIYCPDMEYQDHILQTQLPVMLEKKGSHVGLVVIDSISHHLRRDEALTNVSYLKEKIHEQEAELQDVTKCEPVVKSLKAQHDVFFKSSSIYRNRADKNMYTMNLYLSLEDLARKYNVAIVVSNQVSDKPENEVLASTLQPLDFESQVGHFVGWDNETILSHLDGWRETQTATDIYNTVMSSLHKRRKMTNEPQEDPREHKDLSAHQQQLLEKLHISVNCATKKQVPALGYAWSRRLRTRVLLMKTYRPLVGASVQNDLDSIFSEGTILPSLSKLVDGWSVERFVRVAFAAHAPVRNEFHVDKVPFCIEASGLKEY